MTRSARRYNPDTDDGAPDRPSKGRIWSDVTTRSLVRWAQLPCVPAVTGSPPSRQGLGGLRVSRNSGAGSGHTQYTLDTLYTLRETRPQPYTRDPLFYVCTGLSREASGAVFRVSSSPVRGVLGVRGENPPPPGHRIRLLATSQASPPSLRSQPRHAQHKSFGTGIVGLLFFNLTGVDQPSFRVVKICFPISMRDFLIPNLGSGRFPSGLYQSLNNILSDSLNNTIRSFPVRLHRPVYLQPSLLQHWKSLSFPK